MVLLQYTEYLKAPKHARCALSRFQVLGRCAEEGGPGGSLLQDAAIRQLQLASRAPGLVLRHEVRVARHRGASVPASPDVVYVSRNGLALFTLSSPPLTLARVDGSGAGVLRRKTCVVIFGWV